MDDWEVSASDDEWVVYNPPEAKKVDSLFIPDKLAALFKKIEEDKVLSITGGYPRVGPKKEATPTAATPNNNNDTQNNQNNNNNGNNNSGTPPNITPPPSQEGNDSPAAETTEQATPEDKSFEAFNFEDNDGEKPSMKRKTPGSGKRGKKEKVGSMSNVMSDLLRHKYLDELEAKEETLPVENKGTT